MTKRIRKILGTPVTRGTFGDVKTLEAVVQAQAQQIEVLAKQVATAREELHYMRANPNLTSKETANGATPRPPQAFDSGKPAPSVCGSVEVGINNGGLVLKFYFVNSTPNGDQYLDEISPRVQLLPQTAKWLARKLAVDVDRFEAVHGPICTAAESHRRWKATEEAAR